MKALQEFFLNVKDVTRGVGCETENSTFTKWTDAELQLNAKFLQAKTNVHFALCGNKYKIASFANLQGNNFR